VQNLVEFAGGKRTPIADVAQPWTAGRCCLKLERKTSGPHIQKMSKWLPQILPTLSPGEGTPRGGLTLGKMGARQARLCLDWAD